MGSVKDLVVIKEARGDKTGIGRFVFTDRYSVFDYGRMPDEIRGKGESLCLISAYFFEKLEEEGIKTHYRGVVEGGKVKRLDELEGPSNVMEIELVRVIKPMKVDSGYDYSNLRSERGNYLIPLEVIYRNSLPEGSSVFRRLERGEITLEQLGLDHYPKPNERLSRPILDVSTKLEDKDRYISWDEAREIAGLTEDELEEIKSVTLKIDEIISRETEKAGIRNDDGKIEFAFNGKRELMVVDEVGTPDSCRFSMGDVQISKEVLRKWYRRTEWYKRLESVKGKENWREIAGSPPKLPEEILRAVSEMYMSCCNEITGLNFFDVPKLSEVVREIRELLY